MLQNRALSAFRIRRILFSVLLPSAAIFLFLSGFASADSEKPPTFGPTVGAQAPFSVTVANLLENKLPARLRLLDADGQLVSTFDVPEGNGTFHFFEGQYTALVDVFDNGVPILVAMRPLTLSAGTASAIEVSLLEGSGNRSVSEFDRDLDLVLDRLEIEQGTDPEDARSTPGEQVEPWPSPVLSKNSGWYRGELHAYSEYGPGEESVARLIKRAESEGLDFLAITDPNTLQAAHDPAFNSNKLVLIPALEWGDAQRGSLLVYAPLQVPRLEVGRPEAQALAVKIQAQGGIVAVAHPAVPGGTWQWGLDLFNAVEVWWQGWRDIPPIRVGHLNEEWRARADSGEFIYPIAVAAATPLLSGNAQSTIYYDINTTHGVKAAVIAGSGSTNRKQKLGSPVTFVYGREKSLNGILEGLRKGRTYVSRGPDGPLIEFQADILADGQIDVGMGGIIPINVKSRLVAGVSGAKGGRIDILMNGYPIRSRLIESDKLTLSIEQVPNAFGTFRMRVVKGPEGKEGYGYAEMLAMSSPIYAQSYFVEGDAQAGRDGWINIESDWVEPRPGEDIDPTKLDPSRVVTLERAK